MLPTFCGRAHEDPYADLKEFLRICARVKEADDPLRYTLFSFSPKDEAN